VYVHLTGVTVPREEVIFMRKKLTFLCLGCGETETVPLAKAMVLNAVVRCYLLPQGWMMLYPPRECAGKAVITS
jgi:hypothetical protein